MRHLGWMTAFSLGCSGSEPFDPSNVITPDMVETNVPNETTPDALVANDVALEINGALDRLDAASDVVRRAVDRGVKLVINTDSHHTSELGRMEYGVLTAQRGWTPRELVVNTWPYRRFMSWVAARS